MSIITDIDMPRMNGLELLSEIRCNSRLQNLPVVVITSRDDEQTLLQLEELRATAVLNKPVTDDTVTERLQAIAQETGTNQLNTLNVWN
jgi:CheY-like chemotaxis protein